MNQFVQRAVGIGVIALVLPVAAAAQEAFARGPLNLRAGPSNDYPLVARLGPGQPFQVLGCTSGYGWCDLVLPDGLRGWGYARSIDYAYDDRRVPLATYGAAIGVPIIGFAIGNYWSNYYRDRPWYGDRRWWNGRPPPPVAGWRPPPPPRPEWRPNPWRGPGGPGGPGYGDPRPGFRPEPGFRPPQEGGFRPPRPEPGFRPPGRDPGFRPPEGGRGPGREPGLRPPPEGMLPPEGMRPPGGGRPQGGGPPPGPPPGFARPPAGQNPMYRGTPGPLPSGTNTTPGADRP